MNTSCLCSSLRYFATLLFALIITQSPELIPPSLLPLLHIFTEQFLSTTDHQVIQQMEAKYEYIWSTIVPFVNLAYFPYLNPKYIPTHFNSDERQTTKQLQLLCIEAGVFSLQNMLSGNQVREILVQEELVITSFVCHGTFPRGHVPRSELMSWSPASVRQCSCNLHVWLPW